jgi:uncharacterized MAPEG superfamily protein
MARTGGMMGIELRMLVYSTALLFVLIFIQAQAGVSAQGLGKMAGSRDGLPPASGFAGRAQRTVNNHIENLVMFTAFVLAAVLANRTNHWTALGSQLYFFARLAHAPLYLMGIPWLRSVAFMASVAGMALIFLSDVGVL